jgi:flagellar biogenesis protein FliO
VRASDRISRALLIESRTTDDLVNMVEQILAASFVIGLLLVTVWVLRRKGLATSNTIWRRAGRSKSMQVVEKLQLTAQHSLHLVRLGDELILIGVSPSSCGQIAALKADAQEAEMNAAL